MAQWMRISALRILGLVCVSLLTASCDSTRVEDSLPDNPRDEIYRIPVVVHVIHEGEPVGVGPNLSRERIEGQIRSLNDDYRRRPGTRGYNTHPAGGDASIEFVLTQADPDGFSTDGIVRVNAREVDNPAEGQGLFAYYAHYGYWDPARYLNIWTMPLHESTIDVVLGQATGPDTDLPGADLLLDGEPHQPEGVLINAFHFGESALDSEYNLGRTLTHEIGHYLGLLHPWGGGDCTANDYCPDTPAVSDAVFGCSGSPPLGCTGEVVMVENYMNWTSDRCMNTFTKDQIARMHYVLENSPRRRSLWKSPALKAPSNAFGTS